MPTTIGEFLDRLEASGILDDAKLAAVREKADDPSADGEKFVKKLHKAGDITGYQAQALWKNKGHRLSFGNYVVEDELGRGGMGVVLKARHKRMQRYVGIKVLPTTLTEDADAIARFQREVVAASQLIHTNIVSAFDADEVDGQHILVMEYVDGRDLSSVVKKQGPFSLAQAIDCTKQAASGLAFAHEQGVIHRDIKPANLLLDSKGTVKILDMGLARFDDTAAVGTQAELTGTGTIMGTVDYMSPEQALNTKYADAKSDQYSLGITLYYLLTGPPVYGGDSLMERLLAHREQPIPSLREARPDAPESVQLVFERMVAKKPEDRYETMNDVIAALDGCDLDGTAKIVAVSAPSTSSDEVSGSVKLGEATGRAGRTEVWDGSEPSESGRTAAATSVSEPDVDVEDQTLVGSPDSATLPTVAGPAGRVRPSSAADSGWAGLLRDRRVLGGLGGALVLLLALVFFLRTPKGTLRIEITDPEIEVTVKGTEIVLKGADQKDVSLKPGEHVLHVKRGDFEFDTDKLILKKGETVVVRAELLDGAVRVVRGETVLGSSSADGTGVGTLAAAEPGANNALAFDGTGAARIGRFPKHFTAENFTVEAFVKTDQTTGNYANFVQVTPRMRLAISPQKSWFVGNVSGKAAELRGDLPTGRSVHVAGVQIGKEMLLFVDGKLVGRGESPPPGASFSGDFGSRGYVGTIDEVRLSSVARYTKDFTPPKPGEQFVPDEHTFALYHLDEGTGDTFQDASGNGNHGNVATAKWTKAGDAKVPIGSPTRPGGPSGPSGTANRALEFDGVDDYVLIPSLSFENPQHLTIEATVVVEGSQSGAGNPQILGTESTSDDGFGFFVPRGTQRIGFGLKPDDGSNLWLAFKGLAGNRAVRVAAVLNGNEARLFVDGQEVPTGKLTYSGELKGRSLPLLIGARHNHAKAVDRKILGFFKGRIDEVRVSNVARYDAAYEPVGRLEVDADTLALYHFDEGRGDVLRDASGNGHHGKITGAKWVRVDASTAADDEFGREVALEFDGVDDYVEVPGVNPRDDSSRTVEAWVRPRTRPGPKQSQAVVDAVGASMRHFGVDGGRWGFVIRPKAGKPAGFPSDERPRIDEWTHLAFVWDGARARAFVNGVPQAESLDVDAITNATGIFLGRTENGTAYFAGTVDEVRVSTSARYAERFRPATRLESDADTFALYHFDEGSGNVLKDSSGNAHHGKIVGAKWVQFSEHSAPTTSNLELEFDDVDDYVEIPTLSFDGSHPVTIEATVTVTEEIPTGIPQVVGTTSTVKEGFGIHTGTSKDGKTRFAMGVNAGDGTPHSTSSEPITLGKRVHLAAVLDSNVIRLFVDGLPVSKNGVQRPSGLAGRRLPLLIGGMHNHETAVHKVIGAFKGRVDEVRVSRIARYDAAYEPADRLTADANTLALYHFDEGRGGVLKDSSGNGHHGKIVGAKWVRVSGPANPEAAAPRVTVTEEIDLIPKAEFWLKSNPRKAVKIEDGRLSIGSTKGESSNVWLPGPKSGAFEISGSISVDEGAGGVFVVRVHNDTTSLQFSLNDRVDNPDWKPSWGLGWFDHPVVNHESVARLEWKDPEPGRPRAFTIRAVPDGERLRLETTLEGQPPISWEGLASEVVAHRFAKPPGGIVIEAWAGGNYTLHEAKLRTLEVRDAPDAPSPAVAPATSPVGNVDREVAEWVVAIGGQVETDVAPKSKTLPEGPFKVTGIHLQKYGRKPTSEELARLSELTELRTLSFYQMGFGDDLMAALGPMPNLTTLELYMGRVTDAGIVHVEGMTGLETLNLQKTSVGDAGVASLAKLAELKELNLGYTPVTDAGLVHLSGLTKLEHLGMPRQTSKLGSLKGLVNMTILSLKNTKVTDGELVHLAGMAKLRQLLLSDTPVTDAGLVHLRGLTSLQNVWLSGCDVTAEGVAELQKALPDCDVSWKPKE